MPNDEIVEKYISVSYSKFFENALLNLDKACGVYEKNCGGQRYRSGFRVLIAPSESEYVSIAITQFFIGLEGFLNGQAYYRKQLNFDTYSRIDKKLSEILKRKYVKLGSCLVELSVSRDSITHGHLWIRTRKTDEENYSIKSLRTYMWKPFEEKLGPKFKSFVTMRTRRTKDLKLAIIPLDVSFLDGVFALLLISIVMELCFKDLGIQWRPLFFPYNKLGFREQVQNKMKNNTNLTNWLSYFQEKLIDKDLSCFTSIKKELSSEIEASEM